MAKQVAIFKIDGLAANAVGIHLQTIPIVGPAASAVGSELRNYRTMKTVAIIQARLGSTRLRGKVLRELAGLPMIEWVVTRMEQCQQIDQVIVATSSREIDDLSLIHI